MSKWIRLWDVALAKEVAYLPMSSRMYDVKFHPRGTHVFTGGDSGLYRWPVRESEGVLRIGPARKLPGPGIVHGIGMDRVGRIVAAAGAGSGWILDLTNLPDIARPRDIRQVSHEDSPCAMFVATSPDGKWIATGTHHGFGVKVWETATGTCLKHLIKDERLVKLTFSPDGRWLVAGANDMVTIWATGSWEPVRQIPSDNAGASVFSTDGKLLAIMLSPAVVQLLDPATGRPFVNLPAPDPDQQLLVAISPDGSQLVMYRQPGVVRVWNLRRIREQLKEIDLDWDLPAYKPAPSPDSVPPLRVEVDLGDLKKE